VSKNRSEADRRSENTMKLLAAMTPGERYTVAELASRTGWTVPGTRMNLRVAQDQGLVWQRFTSGTRLQDWQRPLPSRKGLLPDVAAGEGAAVEMDHPSIEGYELQWRTFRDLCMLAHQR
jgi:hypothetical protein